MARMKNEVNNIISIPDGSGNSSGYVPAEKFGYFEMQGKRTTQEDALCRQSFENTVYKDLSPKQIEQALTNTYIKIDTSLPALAKSKEHYQIGEDNGTTASTVVWDGKDNLITATLGDAVSFAVIYDKEGKVVHVKRLNSVIHKLDNEGEARRINELGGFVSSNRVNGILAVSRAIGDYFLKGNKDNITKLVSSEPQIDTWSVTSVVGETWSEEGYCIQIISTCDGFTEPLKDKTDAENQEDYLRDALDKYKGEKSELDIATYLVQHAYKRGSKDNISVAVQTLSLNKPFLLGVYDGHGSDEEKKRGAQTSTYVAQNIGRVFSDCLKSVVRAAEPTLLEDDASHSVKSPSESENRSGKENDSFNKEDEKSSNKGLFTRAKLALLAKIAAVGIPAVIGAVVGSLLMPGVGTIIGGLIGGGGAAALGLIGVGLFELYRKYTVLGTALTTLGGAGVGATIGSILGTLVFPGIGTGVGAALGAGLGAAIAIAITSVVVGMRLRSWWANREQNSDQPLNTDGNKDGTDLIDDKKLDSSIRTLSRLGGESKNTDTNPNKNKIVNPSGIGEQSNNEQLKHVGNNSDHRAVVPGKS